MSSEKSHELLITHGLYTHVSDAKRSALTNVETVRGIATDFVFEITNMGNSSFGGGEITRISFEAIAYSLSNYLKVKTEIPKLELDGKEEIRVEGFSPQFDGIAWLALLLKANDGVPIKAYQNKGSESIGTNQWRNLVYILNKETFNIYQVLRNIEKHTRPKDESAT